MKSPKDILYERILEMRKQKDRIMFTANEEDIIKIENSIIFFEDSISILEEGFLSKNGNYHKRFNKYQERTITRLHKQGIQITEIAKMYDCTEWTIGDVIHKKNAYAA